MTARSEDAAADAPEVPEDVPDHTAVRVALWRALHVEVDPPPHVFSDEVGRRLVAPDEGWRRRPDMDPRATAGIRAGMVARARLVEDLVVEQAGRGVAQYVVLGAGLDTFAQRRPEIASRLPPELLDEADRPLLQTAERGARASGTPFVSFYAPEEMLGLARDAGFSDARHVSSASHARAYFADRTDGLRPSSGEDFLVATT